MDKIYIITAGCYSDYRIVGAFSTKEKADEFLDTCDDDYNLETYIIDSIEPVRKTWIWSISVELYSKKIKFCNQYELDDYKYKKDLFEFESKHDSICFYIESDSRERAIKIASERYGHVVANESFMYPYLRTRILSHRYEDDGFPLYDFNTGEIVLLSSDSFDDDFLVYDVETYDEDKLKEYLPKGLRFRKLIIN